MFGRLVRPLAGKKQASKQEADNEAQPPAQQSPAVSEDWQTKYPELAQDWNDNTIDLLPLNPDDLTDSRYRPVPALDAAAFDNDMPKGLTGELGTGDISKAGGVMKADAAYMEMSRLGRQFLFQCYGVHPDAAPKTSVTPGQLWHGVHKIKALQAQSDLGWVCEPFHATTIEFNGKQETFEIPIRPKVLALMGEDIIDDEPLGVLDGTLLHHLRGWKNEAPAHHNAAAEALMANASHEERAEIHSSHIDFTVHRGMLSEGGDLFHGKMTVETAKIKARHLPGCRGFTFKAANVNDGLDSPELVDVYFKSHFVLSDGALQWTSLHSTWTQHGDSIDQLLSIALPAYMTKSSQHVSAAGGQVSDGAFEI